MRAGSRWTPRQVPSMRHVSIRISPRADVATTIPICTAHPRRHLIYQMLACMEGEHRDLEHHTH